MGNKKKKEKYKNIENNDKNFHKGKKFNNKKENQKTQKMELKEERELKYLRQVLAEYEFTFQEILQLLEWSQKKRKMYKQLLNAWEESGDIYLKRNGRYTLPEKEGFVKGEISISSGNFGFLDINGEASVFIPGSYLNTAMNGDTVLVRILKESSDGKKREGEVYKVAKNLTHKGK